MFMSLADVVEQWNGILVSPMDVYKDIFKFGEEEIQKNGESPGQHKANPIAYFRNNNAEHGYFRIMFEDTFENTLAELQQADFSILNGITYFGRRNVQDHASKMYAMIFDLDGVTDYTLNNFFSGAFNAQVYPIPNYVVLSGHGVHLYYVFEYGVPLFPNIKYQLKELKYALSEKLWNRYTSTEKKKQIQGINQGFRVIGGKTKDDAPIRNTIAYRVNLHPFSLTELSQYVSQVSINEKQLFKESKYTLEDAKKKFPEWYERIVVRKEPFKKWDIAGKVHGENPHALYNWWLGKIKEGASSGHRYFAIMCLAIYAAKCDVPLKRLKSDSYALIPILNDLDPSKPFKASDVDSALECYDLRYCTFPIKDIEHISGIPIPRNKRNGRKRVNHIKYMNNQKNFKFEIGECSKGGRPKGSSQGSSKASKLIDEWRKQHPEGIKADCIRDTKLSKKTVYKWWEWKDLNSIPLDDWTDEEYEELFWKEANEELGWFLREETSGPLFPEEEARYRKFCKNRKTTIFPEKRINMRKYGFKLSQEAEYDEFMRKRRNADGEKI